VRFKRLDLNLLVALEALLETESVSRAAERLHLSQPAVSAALGRLRSFFQDEILIARGKRMYATPFAEALLPQLRECLHEIDALVATSARFDPRESQRVFRIIASDYIVAAVLVPLIAQLSETAAGVSIEILAPNDQSAQLLDSGAVDLFITPDNFIHPGHPAELLFEERHVVVGWSGNPLLARPPSEAEIFTAGHVAVFLGNQRTASFADRQLATLGKQRRIEVTAASFTTIPWFLVNTMRLALMHERLARTMAQRFPIAFAPLPFPFPLMREMAQFHSARAKDESLRWLREQLRLFIPRVS
jgi:DNA-binding transcriptional LysR family regulator